MSAPHRWAQCEKVRAPQMRWGMHWFRCERCGAVGASSGGYRSVDGQIAPSNLALPDGRIVLEALNTDCDLMVVVLAHAS